MLPRDSTPGSTRWARWELTRVWRRDQPEIHQIVRAEHLGRLQQHLIQLWINSQEWRRGWAAPAVSHSSSQFLNGCLDEDPFNLSTSANPRQVATKGDDRSQSTLDPSLFFFCSISRSSWASVYLPAKEEGGEKWDLNQVRPFPSSACNALG